MRKNKNKLIFKIVATASISVAAITGGYFAFSQTSNLEKTASNNFAATLAATPAPEASKTITDYDFINLGNFKDKIDSQNVQNIYNIEGSSYMYVKKKSSTTSSTTTSTTNTIDAVVSKKDIGNTINWVLDKAKIMEIINASRTKKTATPALESATDVIFNKTEYSASSGHYYLNVYATGATGADKGATVILRINKGTGVTTVYYDALQATETKLTISATSTNYKNTQFSQFVIKQDNSTSPILLLLQSEYANGAGKNSFTGISVQGSPTAPGDVQGGIIYHSTSNGFLGPETAHIGTAGNKLIVTQSKWINDGLFILLQYKGANANTASTKTVGYGFSFRGETIQTPFSTEVKKLSGTTSDTFYDYWENGGSSYLVARQKKTLGSDFASTGEILVQKLNMTLSGNNVNISVQNDSKNIKYFNGASLTGVTETYDTTKLPNGASYVAINANNVLVALNSNFEYLAQIALVDVPATHQVTNIKTFGLNYFVYLSNGQVLVYNNNGYVGTSSTLEAKSLESIARISFKDQGSINNGASFFTTSINEFKTKFTQNLSSFLQVSQGYRNTKPLLSYVYEDKSITNKDHTNELTIKVYQDLRPLKANGTVDTENVSTGSTRIYLGEKTYNFYLDEPVVSAKSLAQLPFSVQKTLPSEIAKMYNNEHYKLMELLLNVKKTNLYDKNGDNEKNITVTLRPDDATGRLDITLNVVYANVNGTSTAKQYSSYIAGFASTSVQSDQLEYLLNPIDTATLLQKYSKVSPKELTVGTVTKEFIKLSPFLSSQNYKISMVPNEEKGTIIFTITFKFLNQFLKLGANDKALQVTKNSITWESDAVFKSNITLNEELLIKFNTKSEIEKINAAALQQKPTQLQSVLESQGTVKEKVSRIVSLGLVELSPYVAENISEVLVLNANDVMGEFTLQLILRSALVGSLASNYSYDYSGFAKVPSRGENVFSVDFMTKQDYLTKFAVTEENNLFNLSPSDVTANDLLVRQGNNLSANGILGGLITMSENALNSQFNISLTPDNNTGKLLVTIVFSSFVELDNNGQVKIVNNKKIINYYDGFKPTTENGVYYLNWNSFEDLQEAVKESKSTFSALNLTETKASEFVKALASTKDYDKLILFGELSKAVMKKYKNADSSSLSLAFLANDEKGTLTVTANFAEWNGGSAVIAFSQLFSGFAISEEFVAAQIQNFDPTKSEFINRENIDKVKQAYLPSELTPELLADFFSFQNSILNDKEKIVYFVYDDSIGKGFLIFFVKAQGVASDGLDTTTGPQTVSGVTTFGDTKIILLKSTTTGTTGDKTIDDFNTTGIPFRSLETQGFKRLTKSNTLIEGFKSYKPESNRTESIIALSLAILLPLVLLLPLALYTFKNRNKSFIKYVQNKVLYSLGKKKEEDEEREKLDE